MILLYCSSGQCTTEKSCSQNSDCDVTNYCTSDGVCGTCSSTDQCDSGSTCQDVATLYFAEFDSSCPVSDLIGESDCLATADELELSTTNTGNEPNLPFGCSFYQDESVDYDGVIWYNTSTPGSTN
jgi:hypothetical protein